MKSRAALLLIASLAFAGGSFLTSDFGGFDPNRFPVPQENPPLQPIGFAFSIWLPIYLWLIAGAVFGFSKRQDVACWDKYRLPLILSLAIGTPWIAVAKASPAWSTFMIWLMLLSALVSLRRAPEESFWWARAPVGLYAGWLTAASCVGTSVLLAGYGVLSAQTAAVVMLLVSLLLCVGVILTSQSYTPTYSVAVVWALAGIVVNSVLNPNQLMLVLSSLGILIVGFTTWKRRRVRELAGV